MSDDLQQLASDLRKAGQKLPREIRKTVFVGARNVQRRARDLAPSVHLAGRINFEITTDDDMIRADIESKSPLATIMEFGSPTFPGGRPHMIPALRPEAEPLERFVGEIVDGLLE